MEDHALHLILLSNPEQIIKLVNHKFTKDNIKTRLRIKLRVSDINRQGTYSVVLLKPITRENSEISCGWREWDRDPRAAGDCNATITSSSPVHPKWRKVEETTNLILDLKNVCKVLARWDWAIRAVNSILPWISPLLYTIPNPYIVESWFQILHSFFTYLNTP